MQVRHHVRRIQVVMAASVMAASGYLGLVRAQTPAAIVPETVARNLIVDTLVDDARTRARNDILSPELRVQESLVLLQLAYQRDNTNQETLLLLEESAESAAG